MRPGRMDMHINMSYCTPDGFKILASNYLGIDSSNYNPFFEEIDGLLKSTEVTPAEVAEELMRTEDGDAALESIVNFLKRKRDEGNVSKNKATDNPTSRDWKPMVRKGRVWKGKNENGERKKWDES